MGDSQSISGRFDQTAADDGMRVVRVRKTEQLAAVARLVCSEPGGDRSPARRFLEYSKANHIPIEHLYAMVNGRSEVVASVLAVPNIGRTAMFFASRPRSTAEGALVGRVIEQASSAMKASGVHVGQTLLEVRDEAMRSAFLSGGFSVLAQLSYMERPLGMSQDKLIRRKPEREGIEFQPYSEPRRAELTEVLTASYEGTLDCPGLRGLRDPKDILDGHQATGRWTANLWTILHDQGRAVGAALLNPTAQEDSVELVYIGLAPSARGRGLGQLLLEHALALMADRRERVMTLAMDDANEPAARLYAKHGFRRVLRRVAMIRSLRD